MPINITTVSKVARSGAIFFGGGKVGQPPAMQLFVTIFWPLGVILSLTWRNDIRWTAVVVLFLQPPNPAGQLVAEAASVAAYPRQAWECLRGGKHLDRCSRCRRRSQPGRLKQSIFETVRLLVVPCILLSAVLPKMYLPAFLCYQPYHVYWYLLFYYAPAYVLLCDGAGKSAVCQGFICVKG